MTQAGLAGAARVSRRWLSDLEAGKTTAEFGLIMKTLRALNLVLEASPYKPGPADMPAQSQRETAAV